MDDDISEHLLCLVRKWCEIWAMSRDAKHPNDVLVAWLLHPGQTHSWVGGGS